MNKYFKLYLVLIFVFCLSVFPLASYAQNNSITVKQLQDMRILAENGDSANQLALGTLYLSGNGVEKNIDKAIDLIAKAALQGNDKAQFVLGLIYTSPMFVATPEEEKAQFWFKQSAAQGNKKAINALSMLEASLAKRQPFGDLLKQAEGGDANSQYLLSSRYLHGIAGVEKNDVKARKWLLMSARQGNASAQADLGLMLVREQNYDEGIKFITLAAEQGVVNSQYELAGLYFKGQVIPKDMEKAIYWLKKAAKQGDKRAISSLKVINKQQ